MTDTFYFVQQKLQGGFNLKQESFIKNIIQPSSQGAGGSVMLSNTLMRSSAGEADASCSEVEAHGGLSDVFLL